MKTIGNSTFENCSGFTGNLTIPDSVEEIGDEAFKGCSGLTGSLTIGSSMGSSYWGIGKNVFDGCNFTNIISKSQNAPTLGSKIPDATGKVYIPRNTTSSYQSKWAGHDYTFIEYDREDYPSLIGATPGKNSNSLSGSNVREIFLMKQALSKPMTDQALKVFSLVKKVNKWDKNIAIAIPEYIFTTLDQNKSGKQESTNTIEKWL